MFSYNVRFIKNNQRLYDQARKAMFAVLSKSRKLHLPVDIQLQLFDSMVIPILLYGSEVTGFEKHDILEHLCIQYYKIVLKVKKTTPTFDSVNRVYLWLKLINNNIDGKMLKIIHNLYANAKSCVRIGNSKSTSFSSNIGVRQGENLSPVLFSLFLNDLTEFIYHAYDGLNAVSDMSKILFSNDEIEVYFKLYILLYADDTVILAESAVELQSALNAMFLYCKSWDLEVNPVKTKITIFSNRKPSDVPKFIYNGSKMPAIVATLFPPIWRVSNTFINICTTVNMIKTKQLQHIYMIKKYD